MASESAVLSALAAYREHIASVNHRAMSVLIPQIETVTADDPDLFDSPEEETDARLQYTLRLIGAPQANTQPPIERSPDVLRHWAIVAPQVGLDGATAHLDLAWRAEMRDAYTAAVLRGLERIECPTGTWTLPADFRVVMRHVDSLEGPGWRLLRDMSERLIFWKGWGVPGFVDADQEEKSVRSGRDIINKTVGIDDEYDVAGGWACGSGNEATCYLMYSRLKGGEDWSWRYVASLGQFGTEVFNDVVALLHWYKTYGEPSEGDFDVTADEVFQA
ncbi:hypothetical protein F4824DRAFT_363635 [Ustulina deusta]|nr:hypothetical protein F4823DRAFT_52145 [Ustulina deusta]KAI3341079.1 hypothetical protein F4824DRAFT_363635 [Ustulina deusta]